MGRTALLSQLLLAATALLMLGCDCAGPITGDDAGAVDDAGAPLDGSAIDAGGLDASAISDSAVGPSCGDLTCLPGQRCEMDPAPTCVDNTCADLSCGPTERCGAAPTGTGMVCTDNSCTDDIQCAAEEHCAGGICALDVCEAGTRSCGPDSTILECATNGSGTSTRFTCGGDAHFASVCSDTGGAHCTCEDDWDCPAFTECDVNRCVGTGAAPTCLLPPSSFTSVLPVPEEGFPWGGVDRANRDAVGSAFPSSSQVVMTPVVINLDDDNGDGLIDERDFPEILFMTFCGSNYTSNGVLRAVHGGGPQRGEDFFASCGNTLWQEGDDVSVSCSCSNAQLDPTTTLAAGDLDGDGVPEIVVISEGDRLRIYSNVGELITESSWTLGTGNQAVSIANIDGEGFAELIVGRFMFTLEHDDMGQLTFVDRFRGRSRNGSNGQGPISCVADLDGDGLQEVIGGGSVYRWPSAPAGVTRQSECTGSETDADEVAYCAGTLPIVWNADREGFCAVADVWGADPDQPPGPANPLDGVPEVILISSGRLRIYDSRDGTTLHTAPRITGQGGAPNVDDFDGDGFPEIGTAFASQYRIFDLQPPTAACPNWPNVFQDSGTGLQGNSARTTPGACTTDAECGDTAQFSCNESTGQCVCFHNGWSRRTEDSSSEVTGSSVFDFNGDGAAEVIYNDECYFRIYSGLDGTVHLKEHSPSRTRTENPVVADVDNDGNAEIIFGASNESGFCSEGNNYNNGLEVWGDASDGWVSARRIYNQHSYHVTHVFESGGIPTREPVSWLPYGGRLYNTYRSQPRNAFGVAPDLAIGAVQISSPDATCGMLSTLVDVTVRVVNAGDLRVGPDVAVGFYGQWDAPALEEPLYSDSAMTPLRATLGRPLEPGEQTFVTVRYDASNNSPGTLPARIRVVVDDAATERECLEDNNEEVQAVAAGAQTADLVISLGVVGGACPNKTFETTVRNQGSQEATGIVVRYYAGDPASGADMIFEHSISEPLAPGAETTFTVMVPDFPERSVIVFAQVDPDDTVTECNDGNNMAQTADRVNCEPILF